MKALNEARYSLLFSFIIVTLQLSQLSAQGTRSAEARCGGMKTCSQCITAGQNCAWCKKRDFATVAERCGNASVLLQKGCSEADIISPQGSINFDKNLPPRSGDGSNDAVQLSPQEITLKIRPNEPFKFSTSFRLAENYPVDLYFVMDLSETMKDDKEKLSDLGYTLVQEMRKLTENFRVGFGSFVDKRAMPYVSTVPSSLNKPCENCTAPFGFHHILSLTSDTASFVEQVKKAQISGNLDNLEGGFDAIMQAVTCKSIGWRDVARKILLYSTDGGFHYAGDGKLAGIVIPNDQQCHLDGQGYYSESLTQDYPSISQISQSITDNNVNVIFAVTSSELKTYRILSDFISGSTTGELAADSSNIIDLIRENYDKISGSIEMKADAGEEFSVLFKTQCLGNEVKEGQKSIRCDGLHLAQNVTFEVTVEATSCPADRGQWRKSFKIFPVGLTERLNVTVELTCDCDCEKSEIPNSPLCNRAGKEVCGSCQCNEGRFGDSCECDEADISREDHLARCKMSNTSEVCEGRGQCLCGKCACNPISTQGDQSKRYSGRYCECNDYSCDYYNGFLCGGSDRGVCECGVCKCNPGWVGAACSCSTNTDRCLAKNDKVCNGHGECVCGECVCDSTSGYSGPTCEYCPLCPDSCDRHRACVECSVFRSYDNTPEEVCATNCSYVKVVNELNETDSDSSWKLCAYRMDGCDAKFRYHIDDNLVEAVGTKQCQDPVDPLPIILAVIGGIILLGLLLLVIWKIVITIKDRREYARFEKARENAKWDAGENPIYKQATTTYQNPHFSKSQ